jgi:hypothetical protein
VPDGIVFRLSTCMTRRLVAVVVYRVGRDPPPTAPTADHETDHSIVAVTGYRPSSGSPSGDGCPSEVLEYT